MTAPGEHEITYFPKEPLDLPRPEMSLPKPEEEIPSHAASLHHTTEYQDDISEGRGEMRADFAPSNDVKTLLSWHAPGRPFQPKGKEYYMNILLIMVLLQVVLFLFHEYLAMFVILSFVFVAFALSSVPPHDFFYRISTEGIMVEDHFFLWQELYDFYFKRLSSGEDILLVRTKAYIPGELTIVLGQLHKEHVRQVLIPYLPFREYVKPTFVEKTGEWLAHNFPLEKVNKE